MNHKKLIVLIFITFGFTISEQYSPAVESVREKLRNEYSPKHFACNDKFKELAYGTGKDFHPVAQSLIKSWEAIKVKILALFYPLPCGNCKETSRKIENDINFNIAAYNEEYSVDRIFLRLRDAYREAYEGFLNPALKYIQELNPNEEQLKETMACWDQSKSGIFGVLDGAYAAALQNVSSAIKACGEEYVKIGDYLTERVDDALKEASKCNGQGFGYCAYVYFDDYHTTFTEKFRTTRREAYNKIEQALSGFKTIVNDVTSQARRDYTAETAKFEKCLLSSTGNGGTVQTR